MSNYIDLGEDSILFNHSFELLYILQNSSYYSKAVVLNKKTQTQCGLQVLIFLKFLCF